MALGDKRFTRIPPESTGDRLYMIHTAEIEFNQLNSVAGGTTQHTFQIGEMYAIEDFGGNGMVHVHGVFNKGDGTGVLSVHYNKSATFQNLEPTVGKKIQYNGTGSETGSVANITGFYDVYIPAQNIMGYDNPEYGLDVDVLGSANVRFAEGQPQLDAWGKLRTSGATLLGDYVFSTEDVLDNNFSKVTTQAGENADYGNEKAFIRYDVQRRCVDVGVTKTSDLATATAKTYHTYVPGSSHLFMGTCLFQGAGTVNNPVENGASRRFGLFDAKNGFMFHVGPDGVLYLEQRNSNSGTKVDTLLACSDATAASELGIDTFNKDKVDGSRTTLNPSGMELDLGKNNQYWMDFQWHGSGRVRFGTFHNGERVVMHEYYHNNRSLLPMNQTISLPTCTATYGYTQSEIDANVYWSALSSNPLAIDNTETFTRVFSQAVWTETDIDLRQLGVPRTYSTGHPSVDGSTFNYLFSLSLKPLAADGETNHSIVVPTRITNISYDNNIDSAGEILGGAIRDAIVHWRVSTNTVHHNHQWTDIPNTTMRVSTGGINYEELDNSLSEETRIFEDMSIGRSTKELADTFIGLQNGTWKQSSDDGGTFNESLSLITGSSTGTITGDSGDTGTFSIRTNSGTQDLILGSNVSGTGIPAGSHVHTIDSDNNTFTIRPNALTGTVSGNITYINPVQVTATADRWTLKEKYTKTFDPNPAGGLYRPRNNDGTTITDGFEGMTLSDSNGYLFVTGRNTGVLYSDENYTTPVTSTGTYTGTDAELYGFIGPDFVVSFYAHEQIPAAQDPRSMFVVEWKEIRQE